jgi:hypothetical protein
MKSYKDDTKFLRSPASRLTTCYKCRCFEQNDAFRNLFHVDKNDDMELYDDIFDTNAKRLEAVDSRL